MLCKLPESIFSRHRAKNGGAQEKVGQGPAVLDLDLQVLQEVFRRPSPKPFKPAPEALQTHFAEKHLDPTHVYVCHVDEKPKDLKRKVFLVPVAMNLAVAALFLWRAQYILPYYYKLAQSALGHPNETTFAPADHTWREIGWELFRRAAAFTLDLILEIYVRRSREWDRDLDALVHGSPELRQTFLGVLRAATAARLIGEKTGYLTMSGQWDLDWAAMVSAHHLERRRQVFAFRDALTALDKEHLFFRWIEIVQFESTRPGGFGPEKQTEVATKIRELFTSEGVNFDELWAETVGSDSIVGM
ncbi:unnamed protein product [Parascedosporium putredinis]|uniref:Uncharacterized protein n=1 Tax=Parascedosporium putredinis TaxID=1442378 RepID=A0A9P1H277_9PEZI|nr:unnamed protein product [Parascedosporium putredinis]CAI7994673.1 unnamed protein product [Parascedosporium putredinis]